MSPLSAERADGIIMPAPPRTAQAPVRATVPTPWLTPSLTRTFSCRHGPKDRVDNKGYGGLREESGLNKSVWSILVFENEFSVWWGKVPGRQAPNSIQGGDNIFWKDSTIFRSLTLHGQNRSRQFSERSILRRNTSGLHMFQGMFRLVEIPTRPVPSSERSIKRSGGDTDKRTRREGLQGLEAPR